MNFSIFSKRNFALLPLATLILVAFASIQIRANEAQNPPPTETVDPNAFVGPMRPPPLAAMAFLNECKLTLSAEARRKLDPSKDNPMVREFVNELKKSIVGQEIGIDQFAEAFEMMIATLNDPRKPMGRILLTGPTGVGKTELVLAFVRFFGGNADVDLIRIDGGELQQDHELSRITGVPGGYKGLDRIPLLHPDTVIKVTLKFKLPDGTNLEFVVVLIDEIEKMAEAAYKLALGILDNGKVTLADNTTSFFRHAIIVATSNQGAKEVEELIEMRKLKNKLRQAAGEKLSAKELDLTGRLDPDFKKAIYETYLQALKVKFSPEFLNRWHAIVQFLHLGDAEFLKIVDIMLAKVQKRIFERARYKFAFELTPQAKDWLVAKGTDFKRGARELEGNVERHLVRKYARLLINQDFAEGDYVVVDVKDDALTFEVYGQGMNRDQLRSAADIVYPGRKMLKAPFEAPVESQPLENRSAIVKALASDLESLANNVPAQHVWRQSTKSPKKTDTITQVGGGEEMISSKYIKIGDNMVKLWFEGTEEAVISNGNKKIKDTRVRVEVVSGPLPENVAAVYQGEHLHTWTLDDIEAIIAKAKEMQEKKPEK